jgi:hypothetical protein
MSLSLPQGADMVAPGWFAISSLMSRAPSRSIEDMIKSYIIRITYEPMPDV